VSCLAAAATVLTLAAAGEIWRYVLLVASLHEPLPRAMVTASDVLAGVCGVLGVVLAVACLLLVASWLFPARRYAAGKLGRVPGRPAWQVILGFVVPVVNLTVPFSVLAELEHDVLGRGPREPVRPSRLLLCWLAIWVLGAVLFAITLAWNFRGGLAAEAHGVLWEAATALAAAAVAVLTTLVLRRTTALLLPAERGTRRRKQVLGVTASRPPVERLPRPVVAPR
jgi:hypothetical protein